MAFEIAPSGGGLRGFTENLVGAGFFDFVLPSLLFFALFFGILQMTKLFKTPKLDAAGKPTAELIADRKINGLLAAVISLMVVLPHSAGMYPVGFDPVLVIFGFLPNAVVLAIAVLSVLFLLGIGGGGVPSTLSWYVALASVGILLVVFVMNVFPSLIPWFSFLRDSFTQALVIALLVMGLVGYFVFSGPSTDTPEVHAGKLAKWYKSPPGWTR